jgi:excisionase family DNA binding protein
MMCGDHPKLGRSLRVLALWPQVTLKATAMNPNALTSARRQPQNYFTVDEAGDYLRRSRASLYNLMASGELPFSIVCGRRLIALTDIEALVSKARAA